MAATRLIALHKNKGKSVAVCLKSRTDYAQNPDKTQQGELVSSYECSPLTVDEEFMLSKRQYELMTGRRQKNDVIVNVFPVGMGRNDKSILAFGKPHSKFITDLVGFLGGDLSGFE